MHTHCSYRSPNVTRRSFLRRTSAAGLLPLLSIHAKESGERPNILFVMTDDHAQQAIGAYGSVINRTPGIDRIGRDGAVFLNNTCCNSICAPSRAAILTGMHSHANGQRTNADIFDGSQSTFPRLLQAAGYDTALIGKWHLRSDPTGFSHWEILPGQGHYYNPDFYGPDGVKRRQEGYVTDLITEKSLQWLEGRADKKRPFLLMCQHKAPHRTWAPNLRHLSLFEDADIPEPPTLFDDFSGRAAGLKKNEMTIAWHMMLEYDLKMRDLNIPDELGRDFDCPETARMTPDQLAKWDAFYAPQRDEFQKANLSGADLTRWKYQRYIKDYLRCVASVDESVGRMLDYLDADGLTGNTMVVYCSDQGFYLGEHGLYDKRWMYQESLNMPLLIRWPGRIQPGTRVDALTQNIDFAPTFLEAAGMDAPDGMQGRSLVPLFRGETPATWRKSIYYHYYETGEHNVPRHEGVATVAYKLIHYYDRNEWELFDRANDPSEMTSVYDDPAYQTIRQALARELDALREQYRVPS
ncbi:MAG: sulfatase [Candidatus Hydrogenedentota bacterium]